MRPRLPGLAALGTALAIAACSSSMMTPRVSINADRKAAKCSARIDKVPGTYDHFTTFGTLKGSTYTSERNALVSSWERSPYVQATPGATPSASAPPPAPSYVYYGVFKLKKAGEGCVYFITARSGKPEFGTYNGASLGVPHFSVPAQPGKPVASGEAYVEIKHISAAGGIGTVALKTLSGKVYDSGPITIAGRVIEP